MTAALLSATPNAIAGAWTRGEGKYYAKIGGDFYTASEYIAPDFETPDGQSFLGRQPNFYGELGVSGKHPVQLIAAVPLSWNTLYLEDADEREGPRARATTVRGGDIQVGVQTPLVTNGKPLAAGLILKVPGYANGGVGKKFGDFQDLFPRIGDGQVDATLWLLGGASKGKLWTDAGVGYRARSELFIGWDPIDVTFKDGITFYDTTGLTLGKVIAMVRAEGIIATGKDDYTRQNLSAGPVVLVDIDKGWAVEGRFAYDLWALNATKGYGGGLGISWRKD